MRLLLLTLIFLSLPAWTAPERSVSVSASGYVEAVPDELRLELTVRQTAASLDEARKAIGRVVPRILEIAEEHGIAEDDIDSSRVSAYPEYEHRQQQRRYVGETMTRQITLVLRNPDLYGSLIEDLSKLRLHRINGPTMSHSNIDELRMAALKNAIARGRSKAGVIAEELGMELGKVIQVQEGGASAPEPRTYRMESAMMVGDSSGSDGGFSYAKRKIHARVELSFELK